MHFQWSGVREVGGARAPGSPYLQAGPVPTIQTTCAGQNGPCSLSRHRARPYGIRVGLSRLLPKGICGLGTLFHNLNRCHFPRPQFSRITPKSCSQATGIQNQTVLMFPGHRVPESTDVMFPGHRVPESILSYVRSLQGSRINLSHVSSPQSSRAKAQSGSQGTLFHNLNRCHVPRSQFSRIKPQSCCQATVFQNQASVMLPGHRVPESNRSHVPRPLVGK